MESRPIPRFELVAPPGQPTEREERGSALVFGILPPVAAPAATRAASVVHMLKACGYRLVTGTGPGQSMARHQVNFASESRYRSSAGFVDRARPDEAVVFVRAFDFSRISKPYWYKRRLEEIRRIRFMSRVIRRSGRTTLILDRAPWASRYQITQWATARVVALFCGKRLRVLSQREGADRIVREVSGRTLPVPDSHMAEETAYGECFAQPGQRPGSRLTVLRAEQALAYWAQRLPAETAAALRADIELLCGVARRHELRQLPPFRLIDMLPEAGLPATRPDGRAARIATAAHPVAAKLRVPVTRYMMHLRAILGMEERLPLRSRADARRLLRWYVQDAPGSVPQLQVPLDGAVRDAFLETVPFSERIRVAPKDAHVLHAIGRNANPFALSSRIAATLAQSPELRARFDLDDRADRVALVFSALAGLAAGEDPLEVAGPAADWLSAPLGGDPGNLSRIGFLIALEARAPIAASDLGRPPWAQEELALWVRRAVERALPTMSPLLGARRKRIERPREAMIVGLPRSQTGVGSNALMSRKALARIGLDPVCLDIAADMAALPGSGQGQRSRHLKRSFVLHHVNGDRIPQSILAPALAEQPDALHIGFLLWEFPQVPEAHRLALDMLDEIWTPSSFLRQVYGQHASCPVRNMAKGLEIPEVSPAPRQVFGAGAETTVFLTAFDMHSSVARKNPLAAVEAFRRAFPTGREDVRLVVKTTPVTGPHWGDPERQMERIRAIAAADPRIRLREEYVPFRDLLGLIAGVDCLVSPHRAEGFGLMPAYALGLGRAVIATDYSGTTDFCTERTAFPVPCRRVEAKNDQALYPMARPTWGEIDADALVETMRRMVADRETATARALAGQSVIRSRYAPSRQAARYRRRLGELGVI